MKKRKALDVAVDLFSRVPQLKQVEANIEDDLWDRVGVDFTFVVDAGWHEADNLIIPLITQFMLETDIGVDFMIFPSSVQREPGKVVVFSRDGLREQIEPRRASG